MPKKGRASVDPLQDIANSGYIGYVPDEEEMHQADEPGVIWVDIDCIHDNPYQHAEAIDQDDFQLLVESIKADGFQGALNVSPLPHQEGQYYLNGGGHQRRNAARTAGLTKLPVFVSDEPEDRSVLAFRVARENTTRVNTSIINLGHLYQQMIDEFGLTQEEIAQRIKKDRNHVKFALMAVRSPDDIQDMLRKRSDSLRAMTYFRRLDQIEDRQPIMERFIAGELSTEGVRQAVEDILKQRQGASNHGDLKTSSEPILSPTEEHPSSTIIVPTTAPVSGAQHIEKHSVAGPSLNDALQLEDLHYYDRKVVPETVELQDTETTSVARNTERIQQVRAALQMLHAYQKHYRIQPGPLVEDELQILGEIVTVAKQLLNEDSSV